MKTRKTQPRKAQPLTLEDYLSSTRFPVTTQTKPPLSPSAQLLLDAANWDALQANIDAGEPFSIEQIAVHRELREKMRHHKHLARQVAEADTERERHAALFTHPANRLAAKLLAKMRPPVRPDPRVMALVDLTRAFLDTLPPTEENENLRLHAHRLANQRQDTHVASLFLSDREAFQVDLEDAGVGMEWHTLKPFLDVLHREMRAARSAKGVGRLLAENLHTTVVER